MEDNNVKEEVEEKVTPVGAVDWLKLSEQLVTTHITSKLSCITNYARFGAVCVKWRSILDDDEDYTKSLPPQLPLLMIPTPPSLLSHKKKKKKKKSSDTISCSFYRVTDGKIFKRLRLAMPRDRYVRGSSHGWLITVDEDETTFSVHLMNPFLYPNTATKEIKLPPLTAHPNKEDFDTFNVTYALLLKAIISADPISNLKDCIVMGIFGGSMELAFCKPGDKAWTPIKNNLIREWFYDVIHYEGKFYALSNKGTVVVCNLAECTTETFAGPPASVGYCVKNYLVGYCVKNYLVVSARELFQVHRYTKRVVEYADGEISITKQFKVFKLQRREATTEWVEVKDLCNRVFFVGDNHSMSISPSDFPGCKPNCIYYTDDDNGSQYCYSDMSWYNGPHDLGVFNLENGNFEKHYHPTDASIKLWPAPIWVEPILRQKSIISSKKKTSLRNCLA